MFAVQCIITNTIIFSNRNAKLVQANCDARNRYGITVRFITL